TRLDEADPGVAGDVAVPVEVRRGHRGRVALGDPVLHDLDRAAAQRTDGQLAPLLLELGDLTFVALAVPPQGTDDGRDERAVAGRGQVGVGRVRIAVGAAHDRVLPGRHPEPVQVLLGDS